MDIWAVIPARGGSKRVPRKNLRQVMGMPLIHWSIARARLSRLITHTIVTTDDEEIANSAMNSDGNISTVQRPAHLATDTASTDDTIVHAVNAVITGSERRPACAAPQLVVLLQPTVPARSRALIDMCIREMLDRRADALFTGDKLHFVWWRKEHYVNDPWSGPSTWHTQCARRPRGQDMTPSELMYSEDGSVYVTRWDVMRETGRRLSGRVECVQGDRRVIDIDEAEDFAIAELQVRRAFSELSGMGEFDVDGE